MKYGGTRSKSMPMIKKKISSRYTKDKKKHQNIPLQKINKEQKKRGGGKKGSKTL